MTSGAIVVEMTAAGRSWRALASKRSLPGLRLERDEVVVGRHEEQVAPVIPAPAVADMRLIFVRQKYVIGTIVGIERRRCRAL